ncbi:SMP-30/gluconolactonase/LRE family protein [Sphingopyxis macrogoltabida]|uniref:Gluconolaconase n=1 Tax=Sphingopyxis macrogoltabida TaxID=33050 RepID=A0AAC9FHH2_SPHMC|nr:SMP-30/gluconolactonase/LRE family protein [Sphingopyxis macrogoltabida]ALJ16383.1 gluconolaconase [Sphingopyxis macrogoltabida]AMU92618.1 gluconolaconase [Sphingopyxis macrogoltabida]
MDFEIVGEGFMVPEGPVAFPDDSVVFVEIAGGRLTRLWGDGRSEVVATLGGGPNGAALGPDGALYVCNNGGFTWERDAQGKLVIIGTKTSDYQGGRIERVDLSTGKFERIYTHCGDRMLKGPNDLVIDKSGGIWFSDYGKHTHDTRDLSGLFYAHCDGSKIECVVDGELSLNGVGLSPDESTVYVADTMSARLWAYDLEAPGVVQRPTDERDNPLLLGGIVPARLAATVPGNVLIDSLAVTEAGNVCVGTLLDGGISTIFPDGTSRHDAFPDVLCTNICFGGADRRTAYVTLSKTGRIARARWPEPGLALNFNPY